MVGFFFAFSFENSLSFNFLCFGMFFLDTKFDSPIFFIKLMDAEYKKCVPFNIVITGCKSWVSKYNEIRK